MGGGPLRWVRASVPRKLTGPRPTGNVSRGARRTSPRSCSREECTATVRCDHDACGELGAWRSPPSPARARVRRGRARGHALAFASRRIASRPGPGDVAHAACELASTPRAAADGEVPQSTRHVHDGRRARVEDVARERGRLRCRSAATSAGTRGFRKAPERDGVGRTRPARGSRGLLAARARRPDGAHSASYAREAERKTARARMGRFSTGPARAERHRSAPTHPAPRPLERGDSRPAPAPAPSAHSPSSTRR